MGVHLFVKSVTAVAGITDKEDWFHDTEVNAFMVLYIYLKSSSFVSDSLCSLPLITSTVYTIV